MKVFNGNKDVTKLFRELESRGDLVDVYSKSFFERQPSSSDGAGTNFTKDGFEYANEFESDPDSDLKPLGHLIIIKIDESDSSTISSLKAIYSPFNEIFSKGKNYPDFLLLNIYTKQILCIGLGRKNRYFAIDAATGKNIDTFGLFTHDHMDSTYMARFQEHDVNEVVFDFVNALHNLGSAIYNLYSMKVCEDAIKISLNSGPKSDGLYYMDDESCSANLTGYSIEEMNEFLDECQEYQNEIEGSLRVIQAFFPACGVEDLDTSDY